LSAAAITTSFLGAQALDKGSSAFVWLAMVAFVGVAMASIGVLWPRHWQLTTNPRDVIRAYAESEKPAPVAVVHRDLALHRHSSVVKNDKALAQLIVLFQVASVLLTLEVVLWVVAIALTG
jgi:hypothetical protein